MSVNFEDALAKQNAKPRTAPSTSSRGPMDVSLLEQIVKLMSANDLNTVDVRDGDKRVILKRGAVVGPTVYSHAPAAQYPVPSTHVGNQPHGGSGAPASSTPASDDAALLPIKSPMVGTYYSAATPDAKPFVSVGSQVDEDSDVCVIEAMKVFNNIKAETSGTIVKVLIANGQTVEFGQPLFLVKPA